MYSLVIACDTMSTSSLADGVVSEASISLFNLMYVRYVCSSGNTTIKRHMKVFYPPSVLNYVVFIYLDNIYLHRIG